MLCLAKSDAVLNLAAEGLALSGRLRMRVFGTSMLPSIYPGSEVLISRATPSDIRPGDVILSKNDSGGLRLHRLVRQSSIDLVTRGDNCPNNDPPVRSDELLGVLSRVESRPAFLARARIRFVSLCR